MTSPEFDFPMPAAHIYTMSAAGYTPVGYLELPQGGVHTVIVSTAYEGGMSIHLAPTRSASTRVKVADLEAGAGQRQAVVSGIGVDRQETVFLSVLSAGQAPEGTKVMVQIITTPLVDAG